MFLKKETTLIVPAILTKMQNSEYLKNFAAVKSATKIEEVIGGYLTLSNEGTNLKACCPFHNEKSPSFVVSPAKQVFTCFGCGATGDAIKFVQMHENLSPSKAMEKIARTFNIPITGHETEKESALAPLYKCNLDAVNTFAANLANIPKEIGKAHIRARGINSTAMVRKWGIGYADYKSPVSSDQSEIARTLGLINEKGNCRYGGRITFALHDITGRIIGFAGRDTSGASDAKYINPPASEIYNKSEFLYGLYYAARNIKSAGEVIIVEGYFGVINMHEVAGANMTVATCGTSLTTGQAKMIARITNKALLMYDADVWDVGKKQKKLETAIVNLWAAGVAVDVVKCPNGHDPADLALAYGSDALEACEIMPPAKFFHIIGRELSEVVPHLAAMKSPTQREQVQRDICTVYLCSIYTLTKLIRQAKNI